MAEPRTTPILVVAIDFGTTFSGWAFSFYHDYQSDPTKVSTKRWTGSQYISPKRTDASTSILLDPDGSTVKSFGFQAENDYSDLEEKYRHNYYFFQKFKMMLHGMKTINKDTILRDAGGKELPAMQVFAKSIEFLKDDLLTAADKQAIGCQLMADNCRWVLTVPAIWDDTAKQFMRQSALQAGIPEKNLLLALEPEVASLYFRHLSSRQLLGHGTKREALGEGTVYIVIDAGGGTVDVTVHEILKDGFLKEMYKASGGAWGGTEVDRNFVKFLEKISGKEVIDEWRKKFYEEFLYVMREFDALKRNIEGNEPKELKIRLPVTTLDELTEEKYDRRLKAIVQDSTFGNKVKINRDKLIVAYDISKGFFESSLKSITDHISTILDHPAVSRCSVLAMVGSYSECKMLQDEMRRCFPKLEFIVPSWSCRAEGSCHVWS